MVWFPSSWNARARESEFMSSHHYRIGAKKREAVRHAIRKSGSIGDRCAGDHLLAAISVMVPQRNSTN